jgi:hypothetical protein
LGLEQSGEGTVAGSTEAFGVLREGDGRCLGLVGVTLGQGHPPAEQPGPQVIAPAETVGASAQQLSPVEMGAGGTEVPNLQTAVGQVEQ